MICMISNIIVSNPLFEIFIFTIIIFNTITIILQIDDRFDNFFLIIYTIEMGLKISALGFIFNSNSYLKSNWNKLDFIIVVSSLLQYFLK